MLVAVVLCAAACSRDGATPAPPPGAAAAAEDWFVDRAQASGIDFVHFNGMSGARYAAEIFGPGVALLDYDDDGDLDVFFVQGRMLGAGKTIDQAMFPPHGPLGGRLYRNDLVVHADGTRTLRFTDVTAESGIQADGYGMGVAVGDINNDGWPDIYVTNLGPNQMFRNNGNGTFTDVTKRSFGGAGEASPKPTAEAGWSTSAAFIDFDRDGWLDLYVANYLIYSTDKDAACAGPTGAPDYCSPTAYPPQRDRLYRNRGNGTFEDVTDKALGLGNDLPGLGVVTGDFNGDGWLDIYVANDGRENNLWINQRNGTFKDMGLVSGAAVNADGRPESSMGVDAADFDQDGDEDLYMTHWSFEKNTLYVQVSPGRFEDRTAQSGIGPPTVAPTGFGTGWIDYDNDGWPDLFVANGAVITIEALARAGDRFPLHESNQLFRNLGTGRFEDVSVRAGSAFRLSDVGRGAAFGDIDNDGDIDILVGNNNGPPRLLINQVGNRNHWVGLRLVGEKIARDMLGARVGVIVPGKPTLWRRVRTDGSYASANDPRVLVGLGQASAPVRVRVEWPDGRAEEWPAVDTGTWTTLKQGTAPR